MMFIFGDQLHITCYPWPSSNRKLRFL